MELRTREGVDKMVVLFCDGRVVPAAATAEGGNSIVVPNNGFVRSVCDPSTGEAQYVVSGRLHIDGMGRHLNGQAMKGVGIRADYSQLDADGNPTPIDANGNPTTDPSRFV